MAFNKSKVMEVARKYVDKGQTDRAIKEYLRIVGQDSNDVRVWLKIGDLYAKKGSKREASETYLKVAKFYSEQGFYLKAVAVYKQILKLDARMVEVNLKLAELYRQLGLLSDAMQHFEAVAAHFHQEGKTHEALATIRQLVDLDPDNIATRIKLAELYSKEDMKEEATKEFAYACDFLRSKDRPEDFIKVAERLLWHKTRRPCAESRACDDIFGQTRSATCPTKIASLFQSRFARCRDARTFGPGVSGARPEGKNSLGAQRAGTNL